MSKTSPSNGIEIYADKAIFSKIAFLNSVHSFSEQFDGSMSQVGDKWCAVLSPVNETASLNTVEVERSFLTRLNDYQLREELDRKFDHIREMVVKKALNG